jgi:signal transduction histidine kinase
VIAEDLHLRILVLAHFGRDSELLQTFLKRNRFPCQVLSSTEDMLNEIDRGAATAIVTEESFGGSLERWIKRLELQPPWSDFPLIILTGAAAANEVFPTKAASLRNLGNVTLLERPIRSEILLSALESAMRARMRQYEVRDFVRRQTDSEEALRRTEKLAVAGRLAASIAHEINNPLSAVMNLLYLAQNAKELDKAHQYLVQAEDELRRVSDIANHTLRFHRSSSGPEQVEVRELLDSAVMLFKAKLRNQGIEVTIDCDQDCRLIGVRGEIRQVLVNLIANAIDAMYKGGNLILRGTCLNHPRTSKPGLRISVVDHGEGIPLESRHRLFEPFFTTKGNTGTGLGLWLTKDIIERHRGFIRVRNHKRPHGAVFSFWLPQASVDTGT